MEYNDIRLNRRVNATTSLPTESVGNGLMRFASAEEMLKTLRPEQSVVCMNPQALAAAARNFVDNFPGDSYYAVKSNPDAYVLQHLWANGIRHFDVASLNEIRLIRGLFPDAHLAFMHPIKSREAIRTAYFDYGVRNFVLDTFEEMHKILDETKVAGQVAADLTLIVRIAMPKGSAACPLTAKFGCTPEAGATLLRDADKVANRIGLSFHVGSQTLEPSSYADAIRKAGEVVLAAGVELDVLDVGGGFPIPDLGMEIQPMQAYFDVIGAEIAALQLPATCEVWCEPGRALCGSGATLLTRVDLRKGDILYINDGSFGNMFEVASMQWKNRVQLLRPVRKGRKAASKSMVEFKFYGPTCNSVDFMPGPFLLPEDVCEGDWIEIHGMGAYMAASKSDFNGFRSDLQVEISGEPATHVRRRSSRGHLKLVKAESASAL